MAGKPLKMTQNPQIADKKLDTIYEKIEEPQLKIPLAIPQSVMRKAQKLPPPVIQRSLRNGEVFTVHLVSDVVPAFDPLIKAEA